MPLQRDARVVVVDDDTFFVEAMLVLLPQLGLAPVACAMDGAEAIAVVREHDPDGQTSNVPRLPGTVTSKSALFGTSTTIVASNAPGS